MKKQKKIQDFETAKKAVLDMFYFEHIQPITACLILGISAQMTIEILKYIKENN